MSQPGPKCTVGQMLNTLNLTDSAAVSAALAAGTPAGDLSKVLRAYGYRIMPQTLRRHRNDLCSCSARSNMSDVAGAGSIESALALLSKGGIQ